MALPRKRGIPAIQFGHVPSQYKNGAMTSSPLVMFFTLSPTKDTLRLVKQEDSMPFHFIGSKIVIRCTNLQFDKQCKLNEAILLLSFWIP
jgi:hypothetical protein